MRKTPKAMAEYGEPVGMLVTSLGQVVDVYRLEHGTRLYVPVYSAWGPSWRQPDWGKDQDQDQELGG